MGSIGISAARMNYRLHRSPYAQSCRPVKEREGEAVSCSADKASISRKAQLEAHF